MLKINIVKFILKGRGIWWSSLPSLTNVTFVSCYDRVDELRLYSDNGF